MGELDGLFAVLPDVDPAVSMGVWAIIFVLRGLIPARLISIDGKEVLWGMAVVASFLVLMARGDFNDVANAQDVAEAIISVVTTAAGAILTDGAAKRSGLSDTLRKAATLGGRTNTP